MNSIEPRLKAFVDGVNVAKLAEAVKAGDIAQARHLLEARPDLAGMDMAGNDEHRALHYAVLRRDAAMVRLLMEAGADARKGIFPHRDATSALAIARDREYSDIVAVIEEEERLRSRKMSCPNATVSPVPDQIKAAISRGDNATAIRLIEADASLIHACDRHGGTPLHVAAEETNAEMVAWLLNRRAGVRKRDADGLTALDRAALAADPRNDSAKLFRPVAKLLLEHGAGSDHPWRGRAGGCRAHSRPGRCRSRRVASDRPERRAAQPCVNHGHIETVRLLLELGADVDERVMLHELDEPTVSWGTPLWYAARVGQRDIVDFLGATGTPKCFNCPSQHASPPQISRSERARPNWQNSMAMNWPQLVKPSACRSAFCSWTALSKSPRESSFNTCEKMLHTLFIG